MPYESSLPVVLACAGAAVGGLLLWMRFQRPWILAATVLIAVGGVGVGVADHLVVTDREALVELLPRLASAAETQDVATIMAAVDPELRELRHDAERILQQVRPTDVTITRMEIAVDSAKQPPEAVADLIVRVTGNVIDRATPGTVLVSARVLLRKRNGVWLVRDAEASQGRPGQRD